MALTPEEEQYVKDQHVKATKRKQLEDLRRTKDQAKNDAIAKVNAEYDPQIKSLENEV